MLQIQDWPRKHVLRFNWTGPNHRNVKSRSLWQKNMADYRVNIVFSILMNELQCCMHLIISYSHSHPAANM